MASGASIRDLSLPDASAILTHRSIALAILILVISSLSLHADDDSTCKPRFRSMKAPDEEGCEFEFADFDTRFRIGASTRFLLDDDMERTYGVMPGIHVGLSVETSPYSRFLVEVGYETTHGDPYYDTPGFHVTEAARVSLAPFSVGLRFNSDPNRRFDIHYGFDIVAGWTGERTHSQDSESLFDSSNVALGYRFSVSPEWRGRNRDGAVGLMLSYGGVSNNSGHDVVFMGISARLYASVVL